MADQRKIQLRRYQKKLDSLKAKYPDINLNDYRLQETINEYLELKRKHFYLQFEIEHCATCSQLLPEYKPK